MEIPRTCLMELLVAEHVMIYRTVLQGVQHVSSHEGTKTKPFGELHPLPIPEARWDIVSVNFIAELPDSHGFDATMVIVDSVSK